MPKITIMDVLRPWLHGEASSRSGVTMSLAERGDWGTLITTDFPVSTEAGEDGP